MKCVACGTDNILKDRTRNSGRCKRCNHTFVFEPAGMTDKKLAFTDPFFKKAIEDISNHNLLSFTPKQFLYFIDRRIKARASKGRWGWVIFYLFLNFIVAAFFAQDIAYLVASAVYNLLWIAAFFNGSKSLQLGARGRKDNANNLQILGVIILVIGITHSLSKNLLIGYGVTTVLGLSSLWLGILQKRRQGSLGEVFLVEAALSEEWLRRWQAVNGRLDKLLPQPRQNTLPINPDATSVDPEVSAYSFDRAIVCESDAIAQFLIANNVHFENNCAILSINGYPQSIFDTVMEMLRRNADLKVYVLHDASPAGVSLVHQLRSSPDWFANQPATIFDLGLSPRQILAGRDFFLQKSDAIARSAGQLPDAVRQSLTAQEQAWLDAGHFVELESFAPQRLLRVVNYGLAQSGDPQNSDGLIVMDDGMSYGGGYVFASDSFG
ncbi:MAG TPA: MFS transporter permease [Coleofasciculaceae cyanobacterium]